MKSLIASAKREIRNIKKYAKQGEINRLKIYIDSLDGTVNDKCVYGLMTHNCFSNRAKELIPKCASIYKIKGVDSTGEGYGRYLEPDLKQFVKHKERTNNATYFSKLELLTMLDKEVVQKLIKQIL